MQLIHILRLAFSRVSELQSVAQLMCYVYWSFQERRFLGFFEFNRRFDSALIGFPAWVASSVGADKPEANE